MRFLLSLVILFSFCAQPVSAQVDSNDFRISLNGPEDIEPPSTPTLVSATPTAATQIDLAWTAATDNAIVYGYVVSRDGSAIATTTQLTYADTGLSASTTYGYTMRAFDPSYNYSSSSNSISTTTLQVPEPPEPSVPGGNGGGGTVARVVLTDFFVTTGISTTSFSLQTEYAARLETRWGRTASYELGYTVSDSYTKDHFILLTDLEPGTTYEYEIIGYTPSGAETVLQRSTFVTESGVSPISPANVGQFFAIREGNDVVLSWEIPEDESVAQVRIVRSHLGFPEYPQNGAVVYQGTENNARDTGILAEYSPVYYTAFVYDIYGNVSSGAVAVVYAAGAEEEQPVIIIGEGATTTEEATSTIVTDRLTVDMKMPELSDIALSQGGLSFSFIDTQITLDTSYRFMIKVPKATVSGNLKSIIATISDPSDPEKQYSYLLRINKDGTAYEAVISPLRVEGNSRIVVEIYDYEAYVIGTYQTPVIFAIAAASRKQPVLFPDIIFNYWPPVAFGISILLLLLMIAILLNRLAKNRPADNRA